MNIKDKIISLLESKEAGDIFFRSVNDKKAVADKIEYTGALRPVDKNKLVIANKLAEYINGYPDNTMGPELAVMYVGGLDRNDILKKIQQKLLGKIDVSHNKETDEHTIKFKDLQYEATVKKEEKNPKGNNVVKLFIKKSNKLAWSK